MQEVRPIGLLEMLDQGVLDEKVLAVGKNNPRYNNVWNYTDIYPHMLKEITHFFSIYKDLEGKRVEIKGWHDAAYARDQVVKATKQFQDNKAKSAEPRWWKRSASKGSWGIRQSTHEGGASRLSVCGLFLWSADLVAVGRQRGEAAAGER